MKQDGAGRTLVWMATGAAVLAAGAFLGAASSRRRDRTPLDRSWDASEELADRPVARAALADALGMARRVERLGETIVGLETRLSAVENSAGGRVEAAWQKVMRLEERLDQMQAERGGARSAEMVVREAEERFEPKFAALQNRVDEHQVAIQQLQTQAAQTEANLQKMIAAVEKLTDQISRAFPAGPLRIEPKRETTAPAAAEPESPDVADARPGAEKPGPFRWRSVALIVAVSLGLVGSYATVRRAEPWLQSQPVAANVPVASPDRLLETAILSLETLAIQQPENLGWKYELGRLNEVRQDWAEAERWYRAVLEEAPHDPRALNALADLLSRR